MPTKPTVDVRTAGSQRDNRYLDTFYDQHKSSRFPNGRPWWGYREIAANKGDKDGFVSELSPGDHLDPFGSNWHAPWLPEQNGGKTSFYEFNYQRNRITIRYDLVAAYDRRMEEEYYTAAALIAYDTNQPAPAIGTLPVHGIRAKIGNPPRSPKVAQAAMAGDRWLLGDADEVNVELAKLLGMNRHGLFVVPTETPETTPEAVLASHGTSADIAAMIAQAVKDALAKEKDRDRKRVARSTSATPDAA